jgi:hypothetical protein
MVLLSDVGLVELCSICLEIVLILTQDRCAVCTERTIGSQIVFYAPDGLISDMGHVESCFSPFGDSVSVSARQVHGLHRTYHRHRNRFGRTRWDSLVTRLKWKLSSVRLEIVLLLIHDWCTVCVKRIIGSEIVLEAPDGTHSLRGSCGILFRSVLRQC